MSAFWLLVFVLLLAGTVALSVYIGMAYAGSDTKVTKMQRKVALQHQQFLADQRMQNLTQQALQAMLDASRQQQSQEAPPPAGEWYQP